jgi:hypothetical protein
MFPIVLDAQGVEHLFLFVKLRYQKYTYYNLGTFKKEKYHAD